MKRHLVTLLLIINYAALAQTSNPKPKLDITPPSPEASALAKYGNIPVSAYTGVPNISVPVYTIQAGDIKVPISLNYHASGIRVDEEASWVGLGWSLQANGVISRVIRGKDDLRRGLYFNTSNTLFPDFQNGKTPAVTFVAGCKMPVVNNPEPVEETEGNYVTEVETVYTHRASDSETQLDNSVDLTKLFVSSGGYGQVTLKASFISTNGLDWMKDAPFGSNVSVSFNGTTIDPATTQVAKCPGNAQPVYTCNCFSDSNIPTTTYCETSVTLSLTPGTYNLRSIIGADARPNMTLIDMRVKRSEWLYPVTQPTTLTMVDLTNFVTRHAESEFGADCPANEFDRAPDLQPDQYAFNFQGNSGTFMIKHNKEIMLATQEKIEFTPVDVPNQVGNDPGIFAKWEVRTKDGFKYVFDKYEDYMDENCQGFFVKTAWYLTQIISPKGNTVSFFYNDQNHDGVEESNAVYTQAIGSVYERSVMSNDPNCPGCQVPAVKTENRKNALYRNVTLSRIEFDNGEVRFHYTTNREDLMNGNRLNSISVHKKNSTGVVDTAPVKQFSFNYSYFEGHRITTNAVYGINDQIETRYVKRLKLVSFQETTPGPVIPPYRFNYYEGGQYILPSKGSFARDHWGYYNGKLTNHTLIPEYKGVFYMLFYNPPQAGEAPVPVRRAFHMNLEGADRRSSKEHMKSFTLKEIVYPTGGKTEFKFEQHDFDEAKSNINDHAGLLKDKELKDVNEVFGHYSSDPREQINHEVDLTNLFIPEGETTAMVTFRTTFVSTTAEGLEWMKNTPFGSGVSVNFDGFILIDPSNTSTAKCPGGDPVVPNYSCHCFTDDTDNILVTTCELSQTLPLEARKYNLRTTISAAVKSKITLIECRFIRTDWVDPKAEPISYAGGLRVSEILDYDFNGSVTGARKFNYGYEVDSNHDGTMEPRSYGRRMTKPRYVSYEWDQYTTNPCGNCPTYFLSCYRFVRTSDSVVPLNGSGSGSVVGYDKVEVFYGKDASGKYGIGGKTIFEFENQPDYVFDYGLWRRPGIPNFSYNTNGRQTRQEDLKYNSEAAIFETVRAVITDYQPSDRINVLYGIHRYVPEFASLDVLAVDECAVQLFAYPAMRTEWPKLKSQTEINYDESDLTKEVSSKVEYFYDNGDHMQVTRQLIQNSKGKVVETRMKYPLDYDSPSPAISTMITNHLIDPVIETIQTRDGKIVGAAATKFHINETNASQVLPKEVYALEIASPATSITESPDGENFSGYNKKVTYHHYDDRGNVLEYSDDNNVKTAFVWGYNYTRPVAKIENATYDQVVSALGTAISDIQSLDGAALRNTLSVLRNNLPSAMVTTYTYDLIVGVTSVTDSNNITVYYEYDSLGRLSLVKDFQGNIVKKYDYGYHNE